MKYIRTKDGHIYFVLEENEQGFTITRDYAFDLAVKKEAVIKQADTIDELCDFFVVGGDYKMFYARENGFRNLDIIRRYLGLENCETLYAYIYGEDGDIIKVAKMNEKGELELL